MFSLSLSFSTQYFVSNPPSFVDNSHADWIVGAYLLSSSNLAQNPKFSLCKAAHWPSCREAPINCVSAPVECDNAPIELDKRKGFETGRERLFEGSEGGR